MTLVSPQQPDRLEPVVLRHTIAGARTFRQAVIDLLPDVSARAAGAEKDRRLPANTIEDLRSAGVFRAFVPRLYGGDERSLGEVLDAMTELATACPSTAWVGTLCAIHAISACWLERKGQDEIFADGPDALIASAVAPTGTLARHDGGFRLTGKWSFSSGVEHAAWIMLGANLTPEVANAPTEYVFSFVRAAEAKLVDDWHVSGLRATGSQSIELKDAFVPRHRTIVVRAAHDGTAPGLAVHTQPFYRLPWYPVFICAFPAVGLGAALGMLDRFRGYMKTRVDSFSGRGFDANVGSAVRMAQAAAEIDAARLLFRRDVAALDRAARHRRLPVDGEAERIMYDAPFILDACSRAALTLFRGSGGRAIFEGNALQRHFRDIHAITQHVAMDLDRAGETYGQLLFKNDALALGARETHPAVE